MMDLFRGSAVAHGRTEMTGNVTAKGKHETRCWVERRAAGPQEWAQHLAGEVGLGMPPLNAQNCVYWGGIDVDVYAGLGLEGLNALLQEHHLPLTICRSKSGGPHILMFLKEEVPASEMIEKMDGIASFLGFGSAEIFPKQASVAENEFGAWLNMPYFGGVRHLRYALDAQGRALTTIADFHAYVSERRLTAQQFKDLRTPEPPALFPDGPPCLNLIMAARPTENRNIILANAAVYLKKAHGDAWRSKLDDINRAFPEPLAANEVEAIKKSYDKKEYRYQCPKEPLCSFCDASKCRKMKFGVGNDEAGPAMRSLTKVLTEPPIFYLDVIGPDGVARRVSLTSEQLQSPLLFQRRCMETVNLVPPIAKRSDWEETLRELYKRVFEIPIAEDLTPKGQFIELFWGWLRNRSVDTGKEALLTNLPYRDLGHYYFRFSDLKKYLKAQGFTEVTTQVMSYTMKTELNVSSMESTIRGHSVRFSCVAIPADHQASEPLKSVQFETAY